MAVKAISSGGQTGQRGFFAQVISEIWGIASVLGFVSCVTVVFGLDRTEAEDPLTLACVSVATIALVVSSALGPWVSLSATGSTAIDEWDDASRAAWTNPSSRGSTPSYTGLLTLSFVVGAIGMLFFLVSACLLAFPVFAMTGRLVILLAESSIIWILITWFGTAAHV